MKDIERITLADMMMDIFSGYVQGYDRICQDILGYLNGISFLGYDFQSYPKSKKISLHILRYPFVSYHIPTYPKISSGANSQMPFTSFLDRNGSEYADCNSVAVDRYIVSFDMTDRCCVCKMVLCWFGSQGRFAWSQLICCSISCEVSFRSGMHRAF